MVIIKWYMLNFENKFIEYEDGEWARRQDVVALFKSASSRLLCPYCGSDDVFGNVNFHKGLTFCNKCEGEWEA
jgi:formate dehydrogenase maturation protein FdhE